MCAGNTFVSQGCSCRLVFWEGFHRYAVFSSLYASHKESLLLCCAHSVTRFWLPKLILGV